MRDMPCPREAETASRTRCTRICASPKEVQLHMWTSVLEGSGHLAGGRREGGVVITTRRIDVDRLASTPPVPPDVRETPH